MQAALSTNAAKQNKTLYFALPHKPTSIATLHLNYVAFFSALESTFLPLCLASS